MVRRDSMCGKEGQNGIERKKRWRDGGGKKSMVIHGMAKLRPQRVQPGDKFFSDR